MANEVTVNLHTKVVAKKDLEVIIKSGSSKLGTLLISQGNIEWMPAGNSVVRHQMNWQDFADLMMSEGKNTRKSPKKSK